MRPAYAHVSGRGPDAVEPPHWLEFSNASGGEVRCEAQGEPPPQLLWATADGSPVTPVPGARLLAEDGALVFPAFPADAYRQDVHAASYHCLASNELGTVASRDVHVSAVVDYHYEPRVYDGFVIRGNTAVLKCHVPSYIRQYTLVDAWIRDDGFTINASGNKEDRYSLLESGELLVHKATPEDADRSYRCRTRHRLTGHLTASSVAGKITVSVPLSARLEPRLQTVAIGMPAEFNCSVEGQPVHRVTWRKDGAQLLPDGRIELVAEDRLRIQTVRREDAGMYQCFATNDRDSCQAAARLRLDAGMVLPVNYRQSVDTRGRLLVQQAQKSADEGEYTCAVTGPTGLVASGSTYVSVVVAPVIDDHFFPDVIKVEEGTRSRLMCSVSKGDPPLRFRWLKNGLSIGSHGERIIETTDDSSIIKFGRVRFVDRGRYVCFVSNDAASVNRTVELVVHGSQPRNFSYIHYNFRNHHFINGSLLIREVEESDRGFYLCEAHNGIGPGISKLVFLKVQ
ncbi:hypothetical protein V5799_009616, partial [Amblyomma americanum]